MKTSDKIGNSHVEEMEKILYFITSFNVHKLFYAISERHLDEDAIDNIRVNIQEQNARLERQKIYLFNYTKTCNREYALDDNKLVDSSARLSHKMRSGVRGIKNVLKSFTKKSRRPLRDGGEAQAIDRSLIATENYMRDLFGLESYPACVKLLFQEMVSFYNNMNDCLHEAQRSLSEEKETRNDRQRCVELLEQACEKARHSMGFLLDAMEKDPDLKNVMTRTPDFQPTDNNPVLKAYVASSGDRRNGGEFASKYYHNCSPNDVHKITFYQTVREAEGDADLIACMSIFNCNRERARCINYAISHFDEMLPEQCKRGQIPAVALAVLMRWCSTIIGYDAFLKYFSKRYLESGGKWAVIGKSALSGGMARRNRPSKKDSDFIDDLMSTLEAISVPQEEYIQIVE